MKTPRLAIPVSHLLASDTPLGQELVAMGEGLHLRALPVPDWLPKGGPKIFHCGLGLAEDEFKTGFIEIGRYLAQEKTELFSCDLGPASRRRVGRHPLFPALSPRAIIERSKKSMELVRKCHDGPVAAENYNYYPTGLYEHVCRPDFMARLLEKLDLGLTLDLAHAAISARHLGLDFYQYLDELPLERIVEIHVSKPNLPADPDAPAEDSHLAPGRREAAWLAWLLERLEAIEARKGEDGLEARPWLAVEYYGSLAGVLATTSKIAAFLEALAAF